MSDVCYVCLNNTYDKSPCYCRAKLCQTCLKKIIHINGYNCTICKKELIIDDILNEDIILIENFKMLFIYFIFLVIFYELFFS